VTVINIKNYATVFLSLKSKKKTHLERLLFACLIVLLISSGCRKDRAIKNDSALYGIWVKGTTVGDTLEFFHRNGRNILRYDLSFNAALPAKKETEYIFRDGKLGIQLYSASGNFNTIESFKWKQSGEEFEIQGIELFPFMSSTLVYFTYRKIQ
jgi:hypothetical protein